MDELKKTLKVKKILFTKTINKIIADEHLSSSDLEDHLVSFAETRKIVSSIFDDMLMLSLGGETPNESLFEKLSTESVDYLAEFDSRIKPIKVRLAEIKLERSVEPSSSKSSNNFKLPKIVIPTFSDTDDDPCRFFHFKSAFNNALDAVGDMSPSQKYMYLKSTLRGKAFSLIDSLPADESAFEDAMNLLDKEFLDKDLIVNQIIEKIQLYPPINNLDETIQFITFLRFRLVDLEKFGVVFGDSGGEAYISCDVRRKLPRFFLSELSRYIKNPYPKVKDILNHSSDIFKLFTNKNSENKKSTYERKSKAISEPSGSGTAKVIVPSHHGKPLSTSTGSKLCKFCKQESHVSTVCSKYSSNSERINRAKELLLCVRCLSASHSEAQCPGKASKLPYKCNSCRTTAHTTPMCPSLVIRDRKGSNM